MSRVGRAFELGGVVVPLTAALNLRQRVETVGGRHALRFANGASLRQVAWEKRRVTLSGNGWSPLGLDGLDFGATMTLKCGLPEGLRSTSGIVTLPAARRGDAGYLPFARAHTPEGDLATAVSIDSDVATCTPVSGAISYTVSYFLQLTVWVDPPAREFDGAGATTNWELIMEEA